MLAAAVTCNQVPADMLSWQVCSSVCYTVGGNHPVFASALCTSGLLLKLESNHLYDFWVEKVVVMFEESKVTSK